MSKSRRHKSRRRQKLRRRRRRTTRRRRKARGGGNKSIFKKYQKRSDAPYFKNKLYFPNGVKDAEHFTPDYDLGLQQWLEGRGGILHYRIFRRTFLDHYSSALPHRARHDLLDVIKRCYKEILYDKIRANKNFVDMNMLRCMAVAAAVVATKVILELDWGYTATALADALHYAPVCSLRRLGAMEYDMLTTTDWRTCYEVQKRLGDEIAKGNIPFDNPEHRLWTAAEAHEQGVVPHITLTPAQLRTHQRRYDAGRKIVPTGWRKMKSRKTSEEYYRNITNPTRAQFEHPMLAGAWYQSSPGSETWIEGASPNTKAALSTALSTALSPPAPAPAPPPRPPLRRNKSVISTMVDRFEKT